MLKRNFEIIVPFIVCIVYAVLVRHGVYFYDEVFCGLVLCGGFISYLFAKQTHFTVGLLAFWGILSTAFATFRYPILYTSTFDFNSSVHLSMLSNQSLVFGLVLFAAVALSDEDFFKTQVQSIPYLLLINIALTLIDIPFPNKGGFRPDGIIGNSSIDPSFIGPAIPMIGFFHPYLRKNFWFLAMVLVGAILAIFASRGSVGFGAMIASVGILFLSQSEDSKNTFAAIGVLAVLVFIAFCTFGEQLLSDSNRFDIYEYSFRWWWEHANPFTGTGLGTYWLLGPYAQKLEGFYPGEAFTWMHSDWMQMVFELGFIGAGFAFLVTAFLLVNCFVKKRHQVLAASISYLVTMAFNMPSKTFTTAYLGLVLIRLGFMDDGTYQYVSDSQDIDTRDC